MLTPRIKNIKHKLQSDSRGDTIIEVLIAIAIVSLILAGAYQLSRRSLNTVRDSQEHSQARQIAQAQLENLNNKGGIISPDRCFDPSGNAQTGTSNTCSFDSKNNNNCDPAIEAYCYVVSIEQPIPLDTTYKVTISWDRIGGGKDNVSMFYRLGPGSANSGIASISDYCSVNRFDTGCHYIPGPGPIPDPACGNPCYNWWGGYSNGAPASQDSVVESCTWDWGDGTITSGPATDPANACKHGQSIWHFFPVNAAFMAAHPYPSGCLGLPDSDVYVVTQTMHFNNGAADDTDSRPGQRVPWC